MYCSDSSEAEDLFQEILLQLWKAWPTFQATSKVSTWIYLIGLNTAITKLRKNSRHPSFQAISLAQHAIGEVSSQRLDILFDQKLQAAFDELNKFDRALLMLYLDERSYKEKADIMGLSESNVGVKISRIKKILKEKTNR
jgi:RNA polymerase sigma-70 factor (ECF subfamily)